MKAIASVLQDINNAKDAEELDKIGAVIKSMKLNKGQTETLRQAWGLKDLKFRPK
jgi:hypothetical protein